MPSSGHLPPPVLHELTDINPLPSHGPSRTSNSCKEFNPQTLPWPIKCPAVGLTPAPVNTHAQSFSTRAYPPTGHLSSACTYAAPTFTCCRDMCPLRASLAGHLHHPHIHLPRHWLVAHVPTGTNMRAGQLRRLLGRLPWRSRGRRRLGASALRATAYRLRLRSVEECTVKHYHRLRSSQIRGIYIRSYRHTLPVGQWPKRFLGLKGSAPLIDLDQIWHTRRPALGAQNIKKLRVGNVLEL